MSPHESSTPEPVAIIGMACQVPPDIDSTNALWEFCAKAKCSATKIPPARFKADTFYHPNASKGGHFNVTAGSYLDRDISLFDAPYFQLTEAEAIAMDPQQRLLLETAVHAIENAGLDVNALAGRADVGVFSAGSNSEYGGRHYQDPYTAGRYAALGTSAALFANRISYFFGFRGPSISVDTACSSALTALHFAVDSIRKGECTTAIVGGSFLQVSPALLAFMCNLGTLGKDGKSYSFDSKANGYGRGDGVCAIVLRSKIEAEACSDTIRALIRQTGINHCGRSQGITAPNGAAQLELIRHVYRSVGLSPEDTDFVEGHGTGTGRGDPIEANSVIEAFGGPARNGRPLYLGSVKSNFGHLEYASGLLSVIKCVLMLERKVILPNANFEKLNPEIQAGHCNLVVPTECTPWESDVRRASINNFGFGGSNGHVVLEERAASSDSSDSTTNGIQTHADTVSKLFVMSAKDANALSTTLAGLATYLDSTERGDDEDLLRRLGYTLCSRRAIYDYRLAIAASSRSELVDKLMDGPHTPALSVRDKPVTLLFTGQGAAWAQMGHQLMHVPEFASCMKGADLFLQDELKAAWSLLDELSKPAETSNVHSAHISQPAVTALQIALVSLLRSWGIQPASVCGHSSGEIAAAYTAGFIAFKPALALAYYRGQVAISTQNGTELQKGGMIAVGASSSQVEPLIKDLKCGKAVIACYNSSESVTISGDLDAILELQTEFNRLEFFTRMLKVYKAYHSHHMVPMAQQYLDNIAPWLKKSRLPEAGNGCRFFSSVTGAEATMAAIQAPEYWTTNLVSPVQFHEAMKILLQARSSAKDVSAIIEIGPHGALAGPVGDILNETSQADAFRYISAMKRSAQPVDHLLSTAAALINLGYDLDIKQISGMRVPPSTKMLTDLPPYPFNRDRSYWHTSRLSEAYDQGGTPWNVMLGHRTPSIGDTIEFRNVFTPDDIPWLRDHVVNGNVVFPLAGYVSMAIEALALESGTTSPEDKFRIRELNVGKALSLAEGEQHEMFTTLEKAPMATRAAVSSSWWTFEIHSWSKATGFAEHCNGLITLQKSNNGAFGNVSDRKIKASIKLRSEVEAKSYRHIAASALYRHARQAGLAYGPSFSLMTDLATGSDSAVGTIKPFDTAQLMPEGYENQLYIHPTLLDACLHPGLTLMSGNAGKLAGLRAHVPVLIEEISITADLADLETLRSYVHDATSDGMARSTTVSISCFAGAADLPAIEIRSLQMTDVSETTDDLSDADLINPARMEWIEHLDFLTSESLLAPDARSHEEDAAYRERVQRLERVAFVQMKDALDDTPGEAAAPHLEVMKEWMKAQVARSILPDPVGMMTLDDASSKAEGFLRGVGSQLSSILSGSVDPLTVLDANGLQTVYDDLFIFKRSADLLAKLIGKLSLQNPALRILEVGAGTGGFTSRVLEQLSTTTPSRFSLYCYTDISSVFFEAARKRFAAWEHKMEFSTLDLGREAAEQNFERSDFDLVIAADVIHATPSVGETLSILRALLKPGGTLAMVELSRFSPAWFPWATLPGWWARPSGPFLSQSEWDDELRSAGLKGIDACVRDGPEEHDFHYTIWSHAVPEKGTDRSPQAIVVGHEKLSSSLVASTNVTVLSRKWEELAKAQKFESWPPTTIIVEDMAEPILTAMTAEKLSALQRICGQAKAILWVVKTGHGPEAAVAEFAIGVARALRKEYTQLKFVVLVLEAVDDAAAVKYTGAVYTHIFIDKPGLEESEVDFKLVDGVLKFPRLVPHADLHQYIDVKYGGGVEEQPLWKEGQALQATMSKAGLFDTLHFQHSEKCTLDSALKDDEILIAIRATGVNFKDVLIALGRLPWTGLGKECSGVVLAAGSKANEQGFHAGDLVLHWGDGLFATHAIGTIKTTAKIPTEVDLSFSELASIPIVFATVYEGLVNCARLRSGERLLVHAAAGGVGQAAIQIAQWIGGVEIYCTVGSQEKADLLVARYGIEKSRIFSSRSASDLADGLHLAGQMDVVLNSLSGELLRESWRSLAPFGRFVELGKQDSVSNATLEMAPFDRAVTYSAVDLALLIEHRPVYALELLQSILNLFAQKKLKPVFPVTTMPVMELQSGFRLLQSGKHTGKIVMTNDADIQVNVSRGGSGMEGPPISDDASYLITGGTGGVGQALATWLMSKGAKHILLCSRSGQIHNKVEQKELQNLASSCDARILVQKCDISSAIDLTRLLGQAAAQGMPPFRGVIHGAMVLKDALFESSRCETWAAVSGPKVQGALNLHRAFPNANDLDFFVCLSSVAGLSGNIGQAPYSGSNAAIDAFCKWRGRQGFPALSINFPAIAGVGHVADALMREEVQISDRLTKWAMSLDHVTASMEAAMGAYSNINQVVVGLAKTQAAQDWLADAGALFSVVKWSSASDHPNTASIGTSKESEASVRSLVASTTDLEQKKAAIQSALTKKISAMLMISPESVRPEKSLADMGLDSLVSVELRNWIVRELDANLPVMDIIACNSIQQLYDLAVARSPLVAS